MLNCYIIYNIKYLYYLYKLLINIIIIECLWKIDFKILKYKHKACYTKSKNYTIFIKLYIHRYIIF